MYIGSVKNKQDKARWQKNWRIENKDKSRDNWKKWEKENPEKKRISYRNNHLYKYGMTENDYQDLLVKQNGKCALCKRPKLEKDILVVDHNHKTNKVRGLIHRKCNIGIGALEDNPDLVKLALIYLNK